MPANFPPLPPDSVLTLFLLLDYAYTCAYYTLCIYLDSQLQLIKYTAIDHGPFQSHSLEYKLQIFGYKPLDSEASLLEMHAQTAMTAVPGNPTQYSPVNFSSQDLIDWDLSGSPPIFFGNGYARIPTYPAIELPPWAGSGFYVVLRGRYVAIYPHW